MRPILSKWWERVETDYTAKYGGGVNFYYDNIVNLGFILNAQDRTATERAVKYPAIFLLAGVKENVRVDNSVIIHPIILIVTNSKRDYLFSERQQNVYMPILYPILDNLISILSLYGLKDYTKIDRDYISGALREASVEAGVSSLFNDSLDGIELSGDILLKSVCYD